MEKLFKHPKKIIGKMSKISLLVRRSHDIDKTKQLRLNKTFHRELGYVSFGRPTPLGNVKSQHVSVHTLTCQSRQPNPYAVICRNHRGSQVFTHLNCQSGALVIIAWACQNQGSEQIQKGHVVIKKTTSFSYHFPFLVRHAHKSDKNKI